MNHGAFQEKMLGVMERKEHWSWPAFTSGIVPRGRFHVHLEQDYAVFVRDFAVLVGRAYVKCPLPAVRHELAENLYEEETGGISAGRPHPDMFLDIPRGLGCDMRRFEHIDLLPGAATYRAVLDEHTLQGSWEVACAVTTIFIEGTPYERGELDPTAPRRPAPPLEQHPLVVHYQLPVESLTLTSAHRSVEGGHRAAAWRTILHDIGPDAHGPILEAMEQCLVGWTAFRDSVADACGLVRDSEGRPRRAP